MADSKAPIVRVELAGKTYRAALLTNEERVLLAVAIGDMQEVAKELERMRAQARRVIEIFCAAMIRAGESITVEELMALTHLDIEVRDESSRDTFVKGCQEASRVLKILVAASSPQTDVRRPDPRTN